MADLSRLEDVYRDCFQELRLYAESFVGSLASEDIVHDVFLATDLSRVTRNVRGYLFRAVHNRALSFLVRHDVARKVDVELWDAPVDSIEDQLIELELLQSLRDAIARLPSRQRRTVVLRFFQRRRMLDVVRAIGVSDNIVRHDIALALESARTNIHNQRGQQ